MLAQGLAVLQGVQQLQTAQVGERAYGYGAKPYNIKVPGSVVYVSQALGLRPSAQMSAQARAALGSAQVPFERLQDALEALSAPATAEAWATPRVLVLGPGEYAFGSQVIRRPLTLVCDPATRITDVAAFESSNANTHGSTATMQCGIICPAGAGLPVPVVDAVEIGHDGVATRLVAFALVGVRTRVEVDPAVAGAVLARNADVELEVGGPSAFDLDARDSIIRGPVLRARSVAAYGCTLLAPTVTCDGTTRCRLYSTGIAQTTTWTGGTLEIDTATDFDWTATTSVKANPGGAAPVIMT